jgi:hypothetical protein
MVQIERDLNDKAKQTPPPPLLLLLQLLLLLYYDYYYYYCGMTAQFRALSPQIFFAIFSCPILILSTFLSVQFSWHVWSPRLSTCLLAFLTFDYHLYFLIQFFLVCLNHPFCRCDHQFCEFNIYYHICVFST